MKTKSVPISYKIKEVTWVITRSSKTQKFSLAL